MTSVQTLNDVITASVGTFGTVSDPILRAMVNGYNEFQVDDVLVTIINDDQWLLSDVSNGTLKSSIRAITKGSPLAIGNVPSGAQWADPDDFEDSLFKFWCGCRIRIEPFDCETFRVYGSCQGFFGSNGGGTVTVLLTIDGGSGTLIVDEQVSNNFEFFVDISDFNNQEGSLFADADSRCDTEIEPDEDFYNFDPALFAECDLENRGMEEIVVNANQSERMIVKTYFKRLDWTDTHNAEIFSETSSDQGTTWQKSKGALTLRVDANRLDIKNCDFLDDKFDPESCNSCRHRIARVTWGGLCSHCDGDLVGTFQKVKSGVTLNRTQNVDFVCCQ